MELPLYTADPYASPRVKDFRRFVTDCLLLTFTPRLRSILSGLRDGMSGGWMILALAGTLKGISPKLWKLRM